MIYVVSGRNYVEEALKLSSKLNAEYVNVLYKTFPDGEYYLRLMLEKNIERDSVFIIVNTMYPEQDRSFIETLMLIDVANRLGVSKLIMYIPYIAYSRQDKVFLYGEPVSGEIVLKSLCSYGGSNLYTVDFHNPSLLEKYCGVNILVSDILLSKALEYLENPVVVAPDKGALNRVKYAVEKHGLDHDYLEKHRDRVTGEISMKMHEIRVEGRDVLIIDDIISTGGTIAKASEILLANGARRVAVAASHGLLVGDALNKLKNAGAYKIILGNTLGLKHSDPSILYVDVNNKFVEKIREFLKTTVEE